MKKRVLLLIGFIGILASTIVAENRYWVGGTGAWHNPKNWSTVSGGNGGASVPTANDNVVFDQYSFSLSMQVVQITADAFCNSIDFSATNQKAIIAAPEKVKIHVSGNLILSPNVINGVNGQFVLNSSSTNTIVNFSNCNLEGKLIFNGNGGWTIQNDINGSKKSEIILQKGTLNTNNKNISVGKFISNNTSSKSINLGTSEITIADSWDFANAQNLNYAGADAKIIFEEEITSHNYRAGSQNYGPVYTRGNCTPSNNPCGTFTITIVKTDVTCNGDNDGTALASAIGGSGNFTYLWLTPPINGLTTPNVGGLDAGCYSVRVTDVGTGLQCFCTVCIVEPASLVLFELFNESPSCNGGNDGSAGVDQVGGTPPYTYSWSTAPVQTNDTATNLTAGTYTVTITDFVGCTATTTITVTEPTTLTAPGSSLNVTCNGLNDGIASVVAAGGTPAYSYNWAPAPGGGQGTANATGLAPGSYTCTVTDNEGCTATYTTTITEPATLTSSASQTNVTCGGLCDGTATMTVVGGTAPYQYVWSHGPTTSTPALSNVEGTLCASPPTYTCTVTDFNGCTTSQTFTITEPAVLTAVATGTDVTCFGDCDGTANVVAGGGTAPYSYNWSPAPGAGQGTANVTGLCPNTYTVTVTDFNGCTETATVLITEPTALAVSVTGNNISCFGQTDGDATATPSGGTSPYAYDWDGPVTNPNPTGEFTNNITSLTAGTYTVTVTDFNGCTITGTITITEPADITLAPTSSNATCGGVCDGTASVVPSGGTLPFTYVWNPAPGAGQGTASASQMCAGSYTVTATDFSGCTESATFTITEPANLTVTASATALACNGDCTSNISTLVVGGTAPYAYQWAGNSTATTPSLANQCAGSYTVTVTDFNGCTGTASVTVVDPPALTLTASGTDVTCNGGCDGTATAVAGGGTPGYTYLWMPGNFNTPVVNALCANTYTVTLTDLNGCTLTATVQINNPAAIVPNATVAANVSCSGGNNGSATAAPTGGTAPYTYDWTPGNPTGDGTNTITNLTAGTYTVEVTDFNGCTSTQAVTVTQPAVLSSVISASTPSCNICNGTATVTAAGGTAPYSYNWLPNPGAGQGTPSATGLCPGITYTITVTDANSCTSSATHTVIQVVNITITTNNNTLSCNGVCDGIATANVLGGTAPYIYAWTPAAPPPTGQGTATISNLCAGTYTVTVTDAVGCFNTATVSFVNPPVLTVNTSGTNVSCANGACDGTATATPAGGTAPYFYDWNNGLQTTQTATALCAGTYTVEVTDNNGCTATNTYTITQPTAVDDNENISLPTCGNANGVIFVSPTGGTGPYTYLWTGPAGFAGQGTNLISSCQAGIYTLDITDFNGCLYSFTYLMSNSNAPTTSMAKTDITCNGLTDGTATVTANAGTAPYTYNWLPLGLTGDGTPTVTGLAAGTYTIQVTDFIGCIKFDTIQIVEPPVMSTNAIVTNESCGGSCDGMIVLAPSGGVGPYTFVWAAPLVSTNDTVTNLCANSYTVTTTDANGCSISDTLTITSPATLVVTLDSTNVLCNGVCTGTATANVVGGTAPYNYAWSYNGTPQPGLILPNIINLCPGQWILCVTDANGCSDCDTVNITEPTVLTTTVSQTNINCFGVCNGVAIVTASGGTPGYTYLWNNTPAYTNDTLDSLCVGAYTAIVTDANGCTDTAQTVNITSPTQITATFASTNPRCNGDCNGTSTVTASGGTGLTYTYSWSSTPVQTTALADSLCAGTYTVIITDSLGCTINPSVTLTDPAILLASPTSTSPTCNNGCDGSVTATPAGGTSPYTYQWDPGAIATQTVNNLCPNTYTVIVTDFNNCKDTQSVVLNNTPAIDALISTANSSCGVANGSATINPTTGVPPYTYLWSPAPGAGQGTNSGTLMLAGIYSVTVTDNVGCDSTFVFAINNNNAPTDAVDTINHVLCYGDSTGSAAILSVIGGTPGFSYNWNYPTGGTPNDTVLNLPAGNFFCTITDANGCIYNHPITITQGTLIASNDSIIDATCANICDGEIFVAPTGGTGPYTYLWAGPTGYSGQGTNHISNVCAGTYTLTITDALGCSVNDTFTVNQLNPLAGTITSSLINCFGDCNGTAIISVTTGVAPYSYQWNDPSSQTNDTAVALCAGVYSVTITDNLGCISTVTDTVKSNPVINPNLTSVNTACGLCNGTATVTPTGGVSPYSYAWSNGPTVASTTNLCAGLYSITITDSLGCAVNTSVPISNTNGPSSVSITSTNVTCNGVCNGAVTAAVPTGGTPPYTYLWIHNGSTTATQSNLCAGTYYLQITDSLGCSLIDSVVITEPAPFATNQTLIAPTCNLCDGSIIINPSGGTAPYALLWTPGSSTNDTLLNLCAGVYSVTITDNNGCTQTITIPLNSINGPTLSITSDTVSCYGSCNGTAIVTATGGTTPYNYLWNPGAIANDTASNLCAGVYQAQVTDANGCVSILSTIIYEPDSIVFSASTINDPLCNGDNNGSISVIPTGGTLAYNYAWAPAPAAGTSPTVNNLTDGTYTVTVTDANGCTATQSITLTDPAVLTISNVVTNPTCNNVADGAIDNTVAGGTAPYTYQWSGGSTLTTQDLSLLLPGTYIIVVTDANGCTVTDTITLTPISFVTADAGTDTSFCPPGPLLLDASNSVNAVTYQWFLITGTGDVTEGSNDSVYVNPSAGTYQYYVLATNSLGCTDRDTVTVTAHPTPNVDAGNFVTIFPGNTTTIGGSPTGPTGSSYIWTPNTNLDNSSIANPVASPTVTTTYTVLVTSIDGCTASDTVTVHISPEIVLVNGITPNGDGVNDEWIIPNIENYPNCNVEVYNRWGELLFQSTGYTERWKGVYKGKALPVGTYYYVIRLNDPLYPDPYTGPITIMR